MDISDELQRLKAAFFRFIATCAIVAATLFFVTNLPAPFIERDCTPYTTDPILTIPFEQTTKDHVETWVRATYMDATDFNPHRHENGEWSVSWLTDAGQYRANFQSENSSLFDVYHYVKSELTLRQVIQCFGEPAYYQAYTQSEIEALARIAEFIYPERGLTFGSYELVGWFGGTTATPQDEIYAIHYFPPTTELTGTAPYLGGYGLLEGWNFYSWAEAAVQPWQGWNHIEIISEHVMASRPQRATATAVAVMSALRTTPPFTTVASPNSPTCSSILDPAFNNLTFEQDSLADVHLFVQTMYSDRPVGIRQVDYDQLNWSTQKGRFQAYFRDGTLRSVTARPYYPKLTNYIDCLGQPSHYILTPIKGGVFTNLYLFFPIPGFMLQLSQDRRELPTEINLEESVVLVLQTEPNTESALMVAEEPLQTWNQFTTEEWRALLQPWQGFEQLRIKE